MNIDISLKYIFYKKYVYQKFEIINFNTILIIVMPFYSGSLIHILFTRQRKKRSIEAFDSDWFMTGKLQEIAD